jgi:hypothetical protein
MEESILLTISGIYIKFTIRGVRFQIQTDIDPRAHTPPVRFSFNDPWWLIEQYGVTATLKTHIRKVLVSNLGRDKFSVPFLVSLGKYLDSSSISTRPLPSKSFQII